jgi:hypothetical protein
MRVTPNEIPFWWQRWRNASAYSSSANAQAIARAAWSGCSPGAPNSTCRASPTIFPTVPSWAENDVGHTGKILVEQEAEDARVQRFHKGSETGDVGEESCNFAALPTKVDRVRLQRCQGFNAVAGEQEADRPILDLLAELILPSSRARPVAVPRSGMTGMVLTYSVNSSEKP